MARKQSSSASEVVSELSGEARKDASVVSEPAPEGAEASGEVREGGETVSEPTVVAAGKVGSCLEAGGCWL